MNKIKYLHFLAAAGAMIVPLCHAHVRGCPVKPLRPVVGFPPGGSNGILALEALSALIKQETARWAKVAKFSNIKAV